MARLQPLVNQFDQSAVVECFGLGGQNRFADAKMNDGRSWELRLFGERLVRAVERDRHERHPGALRERRQQTAGARPAGSVRPDRA